MKAFLDILLCITGSYLQQKSYFQLNTASFKEVFQNATVNGELIYHANNRLVIPPLPPLIERLNSKKIQKVMGKDRIERGFRSSSDYKRLLRSINCICTLTPKIFPLNHFNYQHSTSFA